jgi:hypothetical protein
MGSSAQASYSSASSTPHSTSTEFTGSGEKQERGRLFPLLQHLFRLFFFRLIPTLFHAIRIRIIRLVQRIVRLFSTAIHLSFAAILAVWLMFSAWWIAGAVAIGAWTATVAVAAASWIKAKVYAAQYRLKVWWFGSDAHGQTPAKQGMYERLFWWRGYILWPFLWLAGWRRQRLRQRARAAQNDAGHQEPRRSRRNGRPVRSPNGSPRLSDMGSPSLSATSSPNSAIPTPRSASPAYMPRVASPANAHTWRSTSNGNPGLQGGRVSPTKDITSSLPVDPFESIAATTRPHYGLGVHLQA